MKIKESKLFKILTHIVLFIPGLFMLLVFASIMIFSALDQRIESHKRAKELEREKDQQKA